MLKLLFSYPSELPNEIDLVNEALSSNIDFFHIRKPHFDDNMMEKYIEQLDEANHYKIMIHNAYRLINKFDIAGIHLNQKGLAKLRTESETNQCTIEPLLIKNRTIYVNGTKPNVTSFSAHNFSEIISIPFEADYITLSPIYDSISKVNYVSNFKNRKELRSFLNETNQNVIALGGVEPNHVDELKTLGFNGYAMLGSYWQHLLKTVSD